MADSWVKYDSRADGVKSLALTAVRDGLWLTGQVILDRASPNAPLETGTLRRSAVVSDAPPDMETVFSAAKNGEPVPSRESPPPTDGEVTAVVSYNTPYAAKLHEDMSWSPRPWKYLDTGKSPRPIVGKPAEGGPKWLENAVKTLEPDALRRLVAAAMRKAGF